MSSLSARLLISVSVLLIVFFGVTIVVLDTAFRSASEQAQADILDGHLMAILAAAEATDQGTLELPPDLQEPRFGNLDSGLYAELRDDQGDVVWRSRSSLGIEIPGGEVAQTGVRLFAEDVLPDGTPLLPGRFGICGIIVIESQPVSYGQCVANGSIELGQIVYFLLFAQSLYSDTVKINHEII